MAPQEESESESFSLPIKGTQPLHFNMIRQGRQKRLGRLKETFRSTSYYLGHG
jgi:hypothetical protein